jgi:hypothetical protein
MGGEKTRNYLSLNKLYAFFCAKFIKLRQNGMIVLVRPHVSSPKPFDGFRFHLVFGIHSNVCGENLVSVHIAVLIVFFPIFS